MDRYHAAKLAFTELVVQIRFMPNTKQISADIVAEINKVDQEGELELKKIKNSHDKAIEDEAQPKAEEKLE